MLGYCLRKVPVTGC